MSEEEITTLEIKVPKETIQWIEENAKSDDIDIENVVNRMLSDGFTLAYIDAEESVVKLGYVDAWGKLKHGSNLEEVKEDGSEPPENIKTYRKLRETFPPVTAGIEYIKAFTIGSGFNVKINDPNDKYQEKMRKEIEEFNRSVYMDEVTIGLDMIIDVIVDADLTEGLGAAEIVYEGFEEGEKSFEDYAEKIVVGEDEDGNEITRWIPKKMTSDDWKELKGIIQLKPIPEAYRRLKPYRDDKTWKILYYTLDEENVSDNNGEPIRLLPWQVFWLSVNRRGNNLKGVSLVKPIADTALLLQKILVNLGISFDKWADQKFFFVLGDSKSGRQWAPVHIRNFMKDMNKLSSNNATGIAVPAGFDIKSIGGEVYDGGTIIDNLVSMICSGMRYPKTFLEQGKTNEGDKAWLAWLVVYNRYQSIIKNAIEHQLWKRHLWCKYGMTRTVPKQGVPEEKREVVPIYVPYLEWSSEGRWHRESKLKMLKEWLNTGNPITPIFKIGIEEDAAKTLGYTELSFHNQREQIEIQNKIDIIDSKIMLLEKKMQLEALEKFYEEGRHLEVVPTLKWATKIEVKTAVNDEEKDGEDEKDDTIVTEEEKKKKELEERWLNRLKGGINIKNKELVEPRPAGSTRKPNIKKTVEETIEFNEETLKELQELTGRKGRGGTVEKKIKSLLKYLEEDGE